MKLQRYAVVGAAAHVTDEQGGYVLAKDVAKLEETYARECDAHAANLRQQTKAEQTRDAALQLLKEVVDGVNEVGNLAAHEPFPNYTVWLTRLQHLLAGKTLSPPPPQSDDSKRVHVAEALEAMLRAQVITLTWVRGRHSNNDMQDRTLKTITGLILIADQIEQHGIKYFTDPSS